MTDEDHESLPPLARAILAVFEQDLAGVRFGDLDAARLQDAAARARAAEREVEEARVRLDAARHLHDEELARLDALAGRALAYARVYAEGDEALAARLAPLGAPEPPAPRRRKPRRATEAEAELPFEGASEGSARLRLAAG